MDEQADNGRSSGADEPKEDFESTLRRLEEIVSRLEQGNLPLDDALKLYEEGIGAYKGCRVLLQEAESRVLKLVETLEGELEEQELELPEEEGQ